MTLTRTASHNWKNEMVTSYRRDGVVISHEAFIAVLGMFADWSESTEKTENGWRDIYSR